MFEIRNLGKIYYPSGASPVEALKGVSVKFGDKGMIFILGKSGCGKSTLLHLMGGLDRPTSGEFLLDGVSSKDFSKRDLDDYRNRCVGFVFQEYNLLPEFTVQENIGIALQLQGKRAEREKIDAMLAAVGLSFDGPRYPNELSGGQRQRVAIARALIKEPRILFADEPTGALDSKTGNEILTLLKEISAERLVVVVSHDEEFARRFGDRVLGMRDGSIISDSLDEEPLGERVED